MFGAAGCVGPAVAGRRRRRRGHVCRPLHAVGRCRNAAAAAAAAAATAAAAVVGRGWGLAGGVAARGVGVRGRDGP